MDFLRYEAMIKGGFLWNPSTKKCHTLPNILIDSKNYDVRGWIRVDGFGYNAFTDDYEWIRIVLFQKKRKYIESFVNSLRSNSWSKTNGFPFCYDDISGCRALAGDTLNWVAIQKFELYGERFIFGFDLKNEDIFLVLRPDIQGTLL